jgi:hypothetical protein
MRDYPTLHLDTNKSKGTVCSKIGYGWIVSHVPLLLFVSKCNVG